MQRQSWSSVFVVFKTIKVFLAFERHASPLACRDNYGDPLLLFSRLLQSSFAFQRQSSSLACGENRCLMLFIFSKTIRVFRRDLKCLIYFARLQGLLLIYLMPLVLFLLTGFADWASGRSGGEIAQMKLVSLSLLPFYLQLKIIKEGQLSYPNFVRGRSLTIIWILVGRIKLLNTNCRAIHRVLWCFGRKCAKCSKEGQNGHFGDIFQPLGPLGPIRKFRREVTSSPGQASYFWRKQAAHLGKLSSPGRAAVQPPPLIFL